MPRSLDAVLECPSCGGRAYRIWRVPETDATGREYLAHRHEVEPISVDQPPLVAGSNGICGACHAGVEFRRIGVRG